LTRRLASRAARRYSVAGTQYHGEVKQTERRQRANQQSAAIGMGT
jgi:hypothetical protein